MPRYLVYYEGVGTGPRLIDPAPEPGDTLTFDSAPWIVEKVQAPTSPAAMGRVWASRLDAARVVTGR